MPLTRSSKCSWLNECEKSFLVQVRRMQACESTMNPTDTGTPGITVAQLINSGRLTGPVWLHQTNEMWLQHLQLEEEPDVNENVCVTHAQQSAFGWSRISSYRKLINVFAYCLQFRRKQKGPKSAEEMGKSQPLILHLAQRKNLPDLSKVFSLHSDDLQALD